MHIPARKTEERLDLGPKITLASSGAQRPDTRSVSARSEDGVASARHQCDDTALSSEKDRGKVWTQDQARIKRGTKDPIHVLSQHDDDDVMMGTNDVCTPINAMRMATSCLQLIRAPGPIGGQSQRCGFFCGNDALPSVPRSPLTSSPLLVRHRQILLAMST